LLIMLTAQAVACSQSMDAVQPDAGADGGVVDYAIIAGDSLAAAAERYREFRQGQGHAVSLDLVGDIVDPAADQMTAAFQIRDRVSALYEARDQALPFFLLLIGDAEHLPPASYQEPWDGAVITTDNYYADMDGDHLPDLAVGRIPATTDDQVDLVRAKVSDYEAVYDVGAWNRRINIFASEAGFGALIDAMIESAAFDIVESMPYVWDLTMTYGKQTSPYVYIPDQFSDKVYERINEGSLMVTYVGHGHSGGFTTFEWDEQTYSILDTSEIESQLAVVHKQPILSFIACNTGSFDTGTSVSERILFAAHGPSAILSSTEISHPVPSALFIYETGQVMLAERTPTLGEAFVAAKRRMFTGDDEMHQQIGELAEAIMEPDELDAVDRTHQHMYTLFGDPAARIPYPPAVAAVSASSPVAPGDDVQVTVELSGLGAGDARATLESERSTILGELETVPELDDPGFEDVVDANYETANDKVVSSADVSHDGSGFGVDLSVPADLPAGTYHVKVYAHDGVDDAIGSAAIEVTD
jgi:hypothetical protein